MPQQGHDDGPLGPDICQSLLETSLGLVFEEHDRARESGLDTPVVFLLDCEDELGGEIACAWHGSEAVSDAIAIERSQRSDDDATTVLATAVSLDDCRREVPRVFPYLADSFHQPPPDDGFLAVVVAQGGATTFTVPLSARPE